MSTPSQPSSERRASARVPHRVRAVLSTRLGEVTAEVVDMSVGGLGVEINTELRSGDFVRVLLPLAPDDDSSCWVDPDALVARVHNNTPAGRSRLGLSFFQLPAATLQRIAACVAKRLQDAPAIRMPAARPEAKRPAPAATAPPPASTAKTRELPRAAPAPTPKRELTPKPRVSPKPKAPPRSKAPPLHIPRASARELRALFHEALVSLEEDTVGKKKKKKKKPS